MTRFAELPGSHRKGRAGVICEGQLCAAEAAETQDLFSPGPGIAETPSTLTLMLS